MSRKAITQEEANAKAEKAMREKARRHLIPFMTYIHPWYVPARHHELVAEYLEQVLLYVKTEGKEGIGRLIILEPPRYGKTEEVSRHFPAFFLGNLPDKRVIVTSYGADLAEADSKAIRDYVVDDRYQAVFGARSVLETPIVLNPDASSRAAWELGKPYRGGVVASGIGGGLTGFGAHLFLIDDPFKSREDADSEAYRKRVMTWYKSVAYQRLEKGGAMVITHTRWHPEDLVGQLLTAMASDDPYADQWTVLFLPAMALEQEQYPTTDEQFRENLLKGIYIPKGGDILGREPGEPLYPEKFGKEDLMKKQANTDDTEWMSLDQQTPASEAGDMFTEEVFETIEKEPEGIQFYGYIDLALGKSQMSDWNAVMPCGLDAKTGDLVCKDLIHVRALDDFLAQVKTAMLDEANKGVIWGVETVAFQFVVFQDFLKDPELANVSILSVLPKGDKVTRARPLQSRARNGHVKFVKAPWNKTALRQIVGFPRGKHDDIVDTITGALQMIAEGAHPKKKLKMQKNPFYGAKYASVR